MFSSVGDSTKRSTNPEHHVWIIYTTTFVHCSCLINSKGRSLSLHEFTAQMFSSLVQGLIFLLTWAFVQMVKNFVAFTEPERTSATLPHSRPAAPSSRILPEKLPVTKLVKTFPAPSPLNLSGHYRLLLPIDSFVVSTCPTQPTIHIHRAVEARSDKRQLSHRIMTLYHPATHA